MPVKIDPMIVEELASVDLVLWEAKHPKVPFFNEKTGKQSMREDKSWCVVSLAGPGVDEARGGGPTLKKAVDAAIVHAGLGERFPGLRGAVLRLEKAVWDLSRFYAYENYKTENGDEDDIPF